MVIAHNKRKDYEIWLMNDGQVIKRFAAGKVISWEVDVQHFLNYNRRSLTVYPHND